MRLHFGIVNHLFTIFIPIVLSALSLKSQSAVIFPCTWEMLMQADTCSDPIVQMRWILLDGSTLILDKSDEISHNRHHAVCIRWLPPTEAVENED